MSRTMQIVVAVATLAGLALLLWYFLRQSPEDRPPIRVKNGSVDFIIDEPGTKKFANSGWSKKVASGGKRPFRAEAGHGKTVSSFDLELRDGTNVLCSASGSAIQFTFKEVGGRTLQVDLTIDAGHARFDLPEDGLFITTPHSRRLVLDSKTKKLQLVSATVGGTTCGFKGDPRTAEYVVYQRH